jgi:hypothetical protein
MKIKIRSGIINTQVFALGNVIWANLYLPVE